MNKSFSSKHEFLSEYSDLTLSFIFQNLNFFRFSWHTIWWMCRAFTICLLTQRPRLSGPPRYLGRVRKAYKKFSRPTVGKNWEIGWEKFFEKCECEPTRSNWEKELSRFSEKSNNVKRMIKSTTKSKPRKATMLQV